MTLIRFRQEYLEAVASGKKTCTIRLWKRPPRLKPGDRVRLAFGRRDRPTILEAVVERVEEYHIPEEVEVVRAVMDASSDEEAERILDALPEEDKGLPSPDWWPRFAEAMAASGMDPEEDYVDLLVEMAVAGVDTAYAIWFRVVGG